MADKTGADPPNIRSSLARLVGLALIGLKPGYGQYANEYLLALPWRVAASMAAVAADDDVPPF
jgi:hypothetical protein